MNVNDDISYEHMTLADLYRELFDNERITYTRQALQKHVTRGLVPYTTDKRGRKRYDYFDVLYALHMAGLARVTYG